MIIMYEGNSSCMEVVSPRPACTYIYQEPYIYVLGLDQGRRNGSAGYSWLKLNVLVERANKCGRQQYGGGHKWCFDMLEPSQINFTFNVLEQLTNDNLNQFSLFNQLESTTKNNFLHIKLSLFLTYHKRWRSQIMACSNFGYK